MSETAVKVSRVVSFSVEYEAVEDFLVDYTANISIGGMFIKTDEPLEVGTKFRLRFVFPVTGGSSKTIETTAEVSYTHLPGKGDLTAPGMGIKFQALASTDLRFVENLMHEWEAD